MFSLKGPMSYSIIDVMVVLLMAPLAIPVKMTMHRNPERQTVVIERLVEEESLDRNEPLLASFCENDEVTVGMLLAVGEGEVKKRRRLKKGEDFNFFEALIKAVFWLIFLVYFTRVGSGVTVLNNLALIGIAQGVQDTAILLSLFSFGNFAGRLGGGLVSEHYVRSAQSSSLQYKFLDLKCPYFSLDAPNSLDDMDPGLLARYIYAHEATKQHGVDILNSSLTCL
ncbi:hypothetical protein SAY87_029197 [Trapa incisa]|uniref:NFD4 C-terminal domain-containing protein n=1 Tax=Trapa incisa TaxID=236973 RepID=A0AAN7KQG3_9MYRT|nr:hypothetical protein SAY87_029197 [Trapa incisa]